MIKPDKLVFILTSIIIIFIGGYIAGVMKPSYYHKAVDPIKKTFDESETRLGVRPSHFLQPSRFEGSGVTINKTPANQDDLILLCGFFDNGNQLRLIQRDGTVVVKWPIVFSEIFPNPDFSVPFPPTSDWNVDMHGALALPDGSVVFNFEYAGLVKLDRHNNIVWKLRRMTHHSVEKAEGGGFWVPCRRYYPPDRQSPFPPFRTPFWEDTIAKISDDGKILKEISVPGLFYENDLEAFLTSSGEPFEKIMSWDLEVVHLNKVEELPESMADDFPGFKPGFLVLSLRTKNTIFVVDPDSDKIVWLKTGPYIRQHDPEFVAGGRIILFNNNTYRASLLDVETCDITQPEVSNIMSIDPSSGKAEVLWGAGKKGKMMSAVRGKVDATPNGGLLITEFEGGRVFETDSGGNIVWEYINRYDQENVAEMTEARVYPADYFTFPLNSQ